MSEFSGDTDFEHDLIDLDGELSDENKADLFAEMADDEDMTLDEILADLREEDD